MAFKKKQSSQNAKENLKEFNEKYWETEYKIASENWRHGDHLRESIQKYWLTFTTILIAAIGALMKFKSDGNIQSWYIHTICGLGFFISISALFMEVRESKYSSIYFKRCVKLEEYAGFIGQYKIADETYKHPHLSRRYINRFLYVMGAVIWVPIAYYAKLTLISKGSSLLMI